MKKADFLKLAKPYFETDISQNEIYVTDDGQFFWENAKFHAYNYVGGNKERVFVITRDEAIGKTSNVEKIEADKLQNAFDALVIKGDNILFNNKKNALNNALLKYEEALVLKPEDSELLTKISELKSKM